MKSRNGKLSGNLSFPLVFVIVLMTSVAFADEITIVADEWSPYNSKPNAANPGYGIEIAIHVYEEAGHTVIYKIIPWSRAISGTRAGKYVAVIGATKEETPDFIFPEEELGLSGNTFFTKKGNIWKYNGLKSLLTVKVGLIRDYSYGEELDQFFKSNKSIVQYVHGEDPLSLNIKKLLAGRFDVLIEDPNVLLNKAMEMGVSDRIVTAGDTGHKDVIYIAFSPKNVKSKEYAEIFTKGIRKLKDSGKLTQILSKYGLVYWK